jgi:hypothetical protein
MPNSAKQRVLSILKERFGELRKLPGSQSLFAIGDNAVRIYLRYSKVHPQGRTFFGLRDADLRILEGHNSFLCFFTDDGAIPLFVPFSDFEEVFRVAKPASDGQYKVQLLNGQGARELYISKCGRFNVEAYAGFESIENSLEQHRLARIPDLSHSQVQTLLAGIGRAKGYDVYIPPDDACMLDWQLTEQFQLRRQLPDTFGDARRIVSEIDVVWLHAGRNDVAMLIEVEHSTPIYSGLLRFNDVLLVQPTLTRFIVASNDARRSRFARHLRRPTFRMSGLSELASFLDYANVYAWYTRLIRGGSDGRVE